MTEKQFYSSLKVLAADTKILQRNAKKLANYAQRNKKDKAMTLFAKIEHDTAYLKALYSKIQTYAYWNKGKIDQEQWSLFTKEFENFFSKVETIVENIKSRNEVIADGNS